MHGDDHLPAVRVPPFLMAAFLADHAESVAPQDPDKRLWRCKLGSARSLERYFQYLCASGERNWRRLEPKLQRFSRIDHRFFLGVPRRSAPWQLREKGRPSFAFQIIFHDQPKFHASKVNLEKHLRQDCREASAVNEDNFCVLIIHLDALKQQRRILRSCNGFYLCQETSSHLYC